MRRSILVIAFIGLSLAAMAQIHTGPYYSVNAFPMKRSFTIEPRLNNIRSVFNLGWHREVWHNEEFFRTWNVHVESLRGNYSMAYEREFYKQENIPDGMFGMFIAQSNWNIGKPLFNGEIDDPFIWYMVGGAGVSYVSYDGDGFYKLPGATYTTYHSIQDTYIKPNFNVGIGMEVRLGSRWYLNMLANAEYTVQPRMVISIRLLHKKHYAGGFWKRVYFANN